MSSSAGAAAVWENVFGEQVNITAALTDVSVGDNGVVSVDVEYKVGGDAEPNTGTTWSLYVDGALANTTTQDPTNDGNTFTLTGSVVEGETSIRVTGEDSELKKEIVSETSADEPLFELTTTFQAPERTSAAGFSSIDAPQQVKQGEEFTVSLTVENAGNAGTSVTVTGGGLDTTRQLAAGGSETILHTRSMSGSGRQSLKYTLTDNTTGETQSQTIPIAVIKRVPAFSVSDIQRPEQVKSGESYSVTFAVTNRGTGAGDVTVSSEGYSETKTLGIDESAEFTHTRTDTGGGVKQLEYTIANEQTGSTDTVTIPVALLPPSFSVANIDAPRRVGLNQSFDVAFTITNEGQAGGTVRVTGPGSPGSATIEPGESATLTASTSLGETGQQRLQYEIVNQATGSTGEIPIPVAVIPPRFTIANVQPSAGAPVGQEFDLTLTFENTGLAPGTVRVEREDFQQELELAPEETGTVSQTISIPRPGRTEFTYTITNLTTEEASQVPVPVIATEKNVAIRDVQYPETVDTGESYTGTFTVFNAGNVPAPVQATVGDLEQQFTLPPGGTRRIEHQVPGGGGRVDRWTITITDLEDGETVDTETVNVEALDLSIPPTDAESDQQPAQQLPQPPTPRPPQQPPMRERQADEDQPPSPEDDTPPRRPVRPERAQPSAAEPRSGRAARAEPRAQGELPQGGLSAFLDRVFGGVF